MSKYWTVAHIATLMLLISTPLAAQEQRAPAHVYEAYYRTAYADLENWNRIYWEYAVPVLEALRDEGIIEGWGQWQHHTGSDYNIRLSVRTYDWESIAVFWGEYLDGLESAMPADEWDAARRMVVEHRDEIWNVGEVNAPSDFEATHLYTSMFRVSFADIDEWNQIWTDLSESILQDAMDDGLLGGWVRLDHNTGGPYNSKHLFLFDDWDRIDDVIFERLIGTLAEEQPELWSRLNGLFQEHDDVIWEATIQEE